MPDVDLIATSLAGSSTPGAPAAAWVPVAERLPDLDVDVLVVRSRREGREKPKVYVDADVRRTRHRGKWAKTDGYEQVTHWMPLPEPPEAPMKLTERDLDAHIAYKASSDPREIDEFQALDNPVFLLIGAVAIAGAAIVSALMVPAGFV